VPQRLVACIAGLCAEQSPFTVELGDVDVFDTAAFGSVVHLVVILSDALRELHAALVRAVSALELSTSGLDTAAEERLFYPHLTLAQGLTPEGARAAVRALDGPWPRAFVAADLAIGRCGDDGVWHRPLGLRLGATGGGPS
jgi:2'-5' RNA ligase